MCCSAAVIDSDLSSDGVRVLRQGDPAAAGRILASLPEWFGIPAANEHYVQAAGELPSYLAVSDEQVVGVLLIARHFPQSAEIYLIALDAAHRNRGFGSALLAATEADLRDDGVHFLQVKTLGPSRADANYEQTRTFYERRGFEPLEELSDLWPGNPCLLIVKTL